MHVPCEAINHLTKQSIHGHRDVVLNQTFNSWLRNCLLTKRAKVIGQRNQLFNSNH
jgi:hypothetical protein